MKVRITRTRRPRAEDVLSNPVTRALVVRDFNRAAVSAQIHALTGMNPVEFVDRAGRMLFVALGAAIRADISADDPDVSIMRGACNALAEQAGQRSIDESQRNAIVSGLQAVRRLQDRLPERLFAGAAVDLAIKLSDGNVTSDDFSALMRRNHA